MDVLAEQYEVAVLEGLLDPDPPAEAEPFDDEHVWFSMSRIGYDADSFAVIRVGEREPEYRWFG